MAAREKQELKEVQDQHNALMEELSELKLSCADLREANNDMIHGIGARHFEVLLTGKLTEARKKRDELDDVQISRAKIEKLQKDYQSKIDKATKHEAAKPWRLRFLSEDLHNINDEPDIEDDLLDPEIRRFLMQMRDIEGAYNYEKDVFVVLSKSTINDDEEEVTVEPTLDSDPLSNLKELADYLDRAFPVDKIRKKTRASFAKAAISICKVLEEVEEKEIEAREREQPPLACLPSPMANTKLRGQAKAAKEEIEKTRGYIAKAIDDKEKIKKEIEMLSTLQELVIAKKFPYLNNEIEKEEAEYKARKEMVEQYEKAVDEMKRRLTLMLFNKQISQHVKKTLKIMHYCSILARRMFDRALDDDAIAATLSKKLEDQVEEYVWEARDQLAKLEKLVNLGAESIWKKLMDTITTEALVVSVFVASAYVGTQAGRWLHPYWTESGRAHRRWLEDRRYASCKQFPDGVGSSRGAKLKFKWQPSWP